MKVRGYVEEDKVSLGHVLSLAFGGTDEEGELHLDPEHNRRLDTELVYVAEEDGVPRATATVLPLEVYVDGAAVPMGGIAAVATHPAYRRKRLAGELMQTVLRGMRERGFHLSMLDPFAHAFYRRHGYELAAESVAYDLSPAELTGSAEQSHLRERRETDLPAMKGLLERESARHQLGARRSDARWRQILERADQNSKDTESAVYERDGEVEGYLLYRQRESGGDKRILEAHELVARTQRAREALLSFMAAYDSTEWRVRYKTPPREPLHPFLESSHVRATLEPGKMLRLVDVEGALSHLKRPVSRPLVLEVSDDAVPENAGAYTVGEGNVVRGAAAPDRVALDVRRLAQLYAGYLSAEQLYGRGMLAPGSDEALELLDAIFPAGDPWVFPLDHF